MTIAAGTRLGPYEVLSLLGAGGMGEVYRARDGRLGREVAVKFLPEEFFEDPERVARFEREARLLATLNHSGIATVHSFEEISARHILVMELVEGEDLADRIARGPIPLDEALPIARQIAEALEAAHERGIIHRDLKPANVKLTPGGKVKILDFGLAKAFEGDSASGSSPQVTQSPTLTARATQAGMILGTAAYMSPEQARGKPVDKRADIWAFGALLYEMLTGRRAFEGETVSDTLAAVLKTDPDWKALPADTPANLRKVLRRCLERDRARRFHDIADARIELDDAFDQQSASPGAVGVAERDRKTAVAWRIAALLLFAAAAVLGVALLRRGALSHNVVRASILLPPNTQLSLDTIQPGPPAISPDGRRIVFVLRETGDIRRLWLKEIDAEEAHPIEGTEDASYPFWSPDSRNVGFFSGHWLKKVPAAGGPVLSLCDAPNAKGGTWSPEGLILFSPSFGAPIFRVDSGGGTPVPVTKLDFGAKEASHRFPQFLPGGKTFLYLVRRDGEKNLVRVGSLDGASARTILETETYAVFASGCLLYVRDGTLMAQPFDPRGEKLTGQPVAVARKIRMMRGAGRAVFAASDTGALVYQTGEASRGIRLSWVDRKGSQVAAIGPPTDFNNPELSPDGSRIAVEILDPAVGTNDIWIVDAGTGNRMRLTYDPGHELHPIWSPDGRRVAYASNKRGPFDLHVKDLEGGEEKVLLEAQDRTKPLYPNSWSRDGRSLIYLVEDQPTGSTEIRALDLTGAEKPRLLARSLQRFPASVFSPDGHWVAVTLVEGGRTGGNLFVLSFSDPARRWQVTSTGISPFWRSDGKELYYLDLDQKLTAVEVRDRGNAFEWGQPQVLFPNAGFTSIGGGGDRFLKQEREAPEAIEPLTLLLDWPALVAEKRSP